VADLQAYQKIHIVGIGGAGMSAIARVLVGLGITVSGSDRGAGPQVSTLAAEGISVAVGHSPVNVGAVDLVLASSAVPDDNVELAAARERGIPVMRRPDFLAMLTAGYKVLAVAGAHGKTTVCGMLATVLMEAECDPTFIVGGMVRNLGTNARAGKGRYFLIEADEYQNTFLALQPDVAIVTNVEHDHPDIFPSARMVRLAFGDFVEQVKPGGLLIACNDDPVAHAIGASFHANGGRLALYGARAGVGLAWEAREIKTEPGHGVSFVAVREGQVLGTVKLQIPGEYNALNALAVLAAANELGISWETTQAALEHFTGTGRRFELLGEVGGVAVVDDYAHHPTQIRAVLAAARQYYPGRRIVAVWQPHTFSRIKVLWDDFLVAFSDADRVMILPIYAAREVGDGTITHHELAQQLDHPAVATAESLEKAAEQLFEEVRPGTVVLLMGAGDEYVVGQLLLEALRRSSPGF